MKIPRVPCWHEPLRVVALSRRLRAQTLDGARHAKVEVAALRGRRLACREGSNWSSTATLPMCVKGNALLTACLKAAKCFWALRPFRRLPSWMRLIA